MPGAPDAAAAPVSGGEDAVGGDGTDEDDDCPWSSPCRTGGAGTGREELDSSAASSESAGVWLFDLPSALRAFRIARWCLDKATDSSSLVSINVSRVSSSGGGFFAWI